MCCALSFPQERRTKGGPSYTNWRSRGSTRKQNRVMFWSMPFDSSPLKESKQLWMALIKSTELSNWNCCYSTIPWPCQWKFRRFTCRHDFNLACIGRRSSWGQWEEAITNQIDFWKTNMGWGRSSSTRKLPICRIFCHRSGSFWNSRGHTCPHEPKGNSNWRGISFNFNNQWWQRRMVRLI